jgi:hypothetical protein
MQFYQSDEYVSMMERINQIGIRLPRSDTKTVANYGFELMQIAKKLYEEHLAMALTLEEAYE